MVSHRAQSRAAVRDHTNLAATQPTKCHSRNTLKPFCSIFSLGHCLNAHRSILAELAWNVADIEHLRSKGVV